LKRIIRSRYAMRETTLVYALDHDLARNFRSTRFVNTRRLICPFLQARSGPTPLSTADIVIRGARALYPVAQNFANNSAMKLCGNTI
jgi:hypothetical protein